MLNAGPLEMWKQRIALALMLSVGLHILLPLVETFAERHGRNVETFDHVVSWPAWLCSVVVPPGHGIPQLLLPLFFSLGFYAGVFWLLFLFYDRLRKKRMPV
jgi:hypothetical protein